VLSLLALLLFTRFHSPRVIIFLTLPLLPHCCSSCCSSHDAPFVFFSHATIVCYFSHTLVLFSQCRSFHATTPLMLFFSPCHSSHLLFPLSYFSCTVAHFRYLLTYLLLFFSCCHCYFSCIAALFCLVSLVLPLPLSCARWSLELQH